ncbi:DUF1190 family protein [Erwinia sp. E602]|uniref:DUF1190 family protein n=1 Tax=unclassified Erwinia TaxID=2622719 RepID=UPI000C767CD7|nr:MULTISPECIES: DUF1190 family protein [unclassified Erwinia]PLV60804.1 hypothetical protein NV64_11455 [Erwinia sp. B116]QUG74275.1 DUF1190 family protein [Erwinia sp. E602]
MKRTKQINHASFRKSWSARHLTPVALAVTAVIMLAGCEQADETVSMYQNADDCSKANPGQGAQCTTAFNQAKVEAEKTAPKYASREDCVAEFGEGQCQQTAPAQAGVGTTNAENQSSGSFWMPLMAGYMMGRMMSGGATQQQPLFSPKAAGSPAAGQYVDASGKSYGAATPGRTATVPKSAMAPKPATTTTTTRGGFGESVAKQNTMQRSSASSNNSSSRSSGTTSRSFGG